MASATPGDQNRARARNRTDEHEYGKKGDKSHILQGQKWPTQ
jgi:hypothetical protein